MDAHPIQDTAEALQDIFDNSVLCKLQSKPNWGLGFFVGSLEDFTGNHTGHRDKADLKLYRCSSGCTVSYDLLDTSLVLLARLIHVFAHSFIHTVLIRT